MKTITNIHHAALLCAAIASSVSAARAEETAYEPSAQDQQYALDYSDQEIWQFEPETPQAAGEAYDRSVPTAEYDPYANQAYQAPQEVAPEPGYYDVAQPAYAEGNPEMETVAPVEQAVVPAAVQLSADELGTQLLAAVRAGQAGTVRNLLRQGADPEYKPHANALSTLDMVVQGGWVDMATVLYQEGVNFNRRGDQGVTFLHQVAAAGKLPMVRFLLQIGLNPNAKTSKAWTPLHHAARFGHADVVNLLLQAGADPAQRNSDGFLPQELAVNARHLQVAQLF